MHTNVLNLPEIDPFDSCHFRIKNNPKSRKQIANRKHSNGLHDVQLYNICVYLSRVKAINKKTITPRKYERVPKLNDVIGQIE